MIPLIILAAGAAALELKRLASRPQGAEETQAVRERERHLMQVLQELRKEVEKERDEHAAAAARGDALQQQAEQLSEENRGLEQVRDKLSSENEQPRQRAEALADSAEALLSEKYATQKKLETLQAESEADAAKRAEQDEELRRDVAEALELFGMGDLDAERLLAELRDMGIDVDCSAEQLTLLSRESSSTTDGQQTTDWRQSARLLCGSSEQIAKMMSAGTPTLAGSIDRATAAMRAISMTPRDIIVGTPRPGLTGGLSQAAVAVLTPRFFAAKDAPALPKETSTAAKIEQLKENTQPAAYSIEASALHFIKPPKAACGSRPPAIPKLGLNVALGSSSIPAGEPASMAAYAFPSDVESAHPSTEVIHRP